MKQQPGHRGAGFTLIEMTMVIVILGVLGVVALYPMMTNTVSAYQLTSKQVATTSQLRYAIERIAREIRQVQEVAGSYSFFTPIAAGSTIQFIRDDLPTGAYSVEITFIASNVTIQYAVPAPALTRVLTNQATTLTFNYFQADGTPANATNNVAAVQIRLDVADPVSGMSLTQQTRVALRN